MTTDAQTTTKQKTRRYPTTVTCMKCGGPVLALNALEARLISQWPRDGHWLCPGCRTKWGAGR